ncbi:MAG: hypothetical protein KDC87_08800 [Planctomycetes bacterium]|nr:hypothetical protein [Planctomycetota bacterium]
MGWFRRRIEVRFVDGRSGAVLAVSRVPVDQLPDDFALDTQLHFAGQHFVVLGR